MSLKVNFGQRPFRFDIEAHCSSLTARSREIASMLPPEIFEQILEDTLVQFDDDLVHTETRYKAQPRRNWLMQVCRRWRTVCSRHKFACLWLDSQEDLSRVVALPEPLTCDTLGTISQPEAPWIHQLLLSQLPVSFTFYKWDCTLYTSVLWDRLPPALSTRIPALMHSAGLSRIQELRLEYWTLPSWIRFAQFLFAFPNLQKLVTDGIHLDPDEPLDTLPPWLRFHRRLSLWEAQTSDYTGPENINFRFLLLFIAGRPRRPLREKDFTPHGLTLAREDLNVMVQFVKILAHLCRISQIDYAESSDPKSPGQSSSYAVVANTLKLCVGIVITGTRQDDRELLRLEFHPHINFHQLVSVRVAWDLQTPASYPEKLQHLLGSLSSSDICKCSFELSKVDISYQIEDRMIESARSLRRHIALGMARRNAVDLVEFTYAGEVLKAQDELDLTSGIRWMAEHPVKFSFTAQYGFVLPMGEMCSISWCV